MQVLRHWEHEWLLVPGPQGVIVHENQKTQSST